MSEMLLNQLRALKVQEAQLQNALAIIHEAQLQDAEAIIMAEVKANKYELSVISKALSYYEKVEKQVAS